MVAPSLDAGDEAAFQKINRPHRDISIEKLIFGLCEFRKEFSGELWLEIFLVEGINTDIEQIKKIKNIIARINPDKIQLNTAVRPTADRAVQRLGIEKLRAIAEELGPKCEIISSDPLAGDMQSQHTETEKTVLSVLKRRPCSVNDVCSGLGLSRNEVLKCITALQQQGLVVCEEKDGTVFFKAKVDL